MQWLEAEPRQIQSRNRPHFLLVTTGTIYIGSWCILYHLWSWNQVLIFVWLRCGSSNRRYELDEDDWMLYRRSDEMVVMTVKYICLPTYNQSRLCPNEFIVQCCPKLESIFISRRLGPSVVWLSKGTGRAGSWWSHDCTSSPNTRYTQCVWAPGDKWVTLMEFFFPSKNRAQTKCLL